LRPKCLCGGGRMTDMPHADLLRGVLTGALQADRKTFETIFALPENADIVVRPFEAGGFALCVIYTEGMAQSDKVADFILRACHAFDAGAEAVAPEARADHLLKSAVCIPQARIENRVRELVEQILGGMTALIIDGCRDGLLMETRGFE